MTTLAKPRGPVAPILADYETKDEIRAKVLELLGGIAPEVDLASLRTDRPLREQVELDSFDTLQLMVRVSKAFGVDIPEATYAKMRTLDELVEHVAHAKA